MFFWVTIAILWLFQLYGVVKINYPPSAEQLRILGPLLRNLSGEFCLWGLRFFSLLLLLWGLALLYKIILSKHGIFLAKSSVFFILLSPSFLVAWMSRPIVVLKFFFVCLFLWLFFVKKIKYIFIFAFVFLLSWNVLIDKERGAIFNKLDLKDGQKEVAERFSAEDSLVDRVFLPLNLRRVAYNKYFFAYKQILAEIIPFFDLETIFYQEVHPMEQKSVVLFVWPEIFLFFYGIFVWQTAKNKKYKNFWLWFILPFWTFIFSGGELWQRFLPILIPISLLMAMAINKLFLLSKKKFCLAKVCLLTLLLLTIYGSLVNFCDLMTRTDYWLDNRPLAYEFFYKEINKKNLDEMKSINVTSLIGDSRPYCYFYLGKVCKQDKFNFESFQLSDSLVEEKSLWAGFAGEFVGSELKNNLPENWLELVSQNGMTVESGLELRDTVAYKYGNDLLVVSKK